VRKLILVICVCILATSCRTARYANHYNANLEQFSKLIRPVQKPREMGDSIKSVLNENIEKNQEIITKNGTRYLIPLTLGTAGAIIGATINIGKANNKLLLGASIAAIVVSVIDLVIYIPGQMACNKKTLEIISEWNNSDKDNKALTSLRASLFTLQESWPAYAP